MKSSTFELDLRQIIIIIIYSGYPLFSVGPAKIMYNTVTIQCDTIPPNVQYDTIRISKTYWFYDYMYV